MEKLMRPSTMTPTAIKMSTDRTRADRDLDPRYKLAMKLLILLVCGAISFLAGLAFSHKVRAAETVSSSASNTPADGKQPKVVYPKKTSIDFDGASIEGELRNPGEFYFQHRPEDKMDSLVKRRKNFHRELLRDAVMSK